VLKYGIAFHHGSLPLFIRKRIEDLYSKKKINFIFCTSTLLEGVNLPTKNVFIYPFPKKTVNDEKKCRLDFWNLAGRAGRYRSELTGNIVCLNTADNNWSNADAKISLGNNVIIEDEINSTLLRHQKILNYFDGKVKSPTNDIIQLSSLILSEILTYLDKGYIGRILNTFNEKIRFMLIDSGKKHLDRNRIIEIDKVTFSENHIFSTSIHAKAQLNAKNKEKLLRSYSREDVFNYLETINEIYGLRNTPDSLNQLCIVTYSWLMGNTLNLLISNAIKYSNSVRDPISYRWVKFDKTNPDHINAKIMEAIQCIESEVTFKLETCIAHFYQLCQSIHGDENAGINLSPYLEYGTLDTNIIELQEFGFSRLAAIEIIAKHKECVTFKTNETSLQINTQKLRAKIEKHSVIDRELSWLNL
ncbi:TPA: histidine kinase, partial [Escherichia coli]|nr:histidine kinase [Escherichia coli]HAL1340744.1 histidine kinase [Escherichia coli]HBN6571216.1 histidine kinase [Escherichia coli]